MNQKFTLIVGAFFGMMGVGVGAFGAHALKKLLTENGRVDTYELAVKYQFYHSLTLIALGILMEKYTTSSLQWSSLSISLGIFLFSGSLYMFALTNKPVFAMITPLGGLLLIAGWAILLFAIIKN